MAKMNRPTLLTLAFIFLRLCKENFGAVADFS